MKRKSMYFLTGIFAGLLLAVSCVTALASDGALTITIHPINILVNGEVFQPKDVNGEDVMCFTVNGTTYAPLRAMAEAYGLDVGYDAARNLATVNAPGIGGTAPQPAVPAAGTDFAGAWTVKEKPVTDYGNEKIFTAVYAGDLSMNEFKAWWKSFNADTIAAHAEQMAAECQSFVPGYRVTLYFSYGTYSLGTAYALDGYQLSNFNPADVWIK